MVILKNKNQPFYFFKKNMIKKMFFSFKKNVLNIKYSKTCNL